MLGQAQARTGRQTCLDISGVCASVVVIDHQPNIGIERAASATIVREGAWLKPRIRSGFGHAIATAASHSRRMPIPKARECPRLKANTAFDATSNSPFIDRCRIRWQERSGRRLTPGRACRGHEPGCPGSNGNRADRRRRRLLPWRAELGQHRPLTRQAVEVGSLVVAGGRLFCALLNLARVPRFGGIGAAITQCVSFAFIALASSPRPGQIPRSFGLASPRDNHGHHPGRRGLSLPDRGIETAPIVC